jgi:hypothetical protein
VQVAGRVSFLSCVFFFFSSLFHGGWLVGWQGMAGGCSWWMGAGLVSANIIFGFDLADDL